MDETERLRLLEWGLTLMGDREQQPGPKSLTRILQSVASIEDIALTHEDVDSVWRDILDEDPNQSARQVFGRYLRRWDTYASAAWVKDTPPLTKERRRLIYLLLDGEPWSEELDEKFTLARPVSPSFVIASEHEPWYSEERRRQQSFFWDAYKRYLAEKSDWDDDSIDDVDKASTLVVERLSDPERNEIYATKGLVAGYVQSGKTANFTAVIAKAADAGYRLIVVLAGTLNLLREQTQRRIDKELIGQEVIHAEGGSDTSHDYATDKDWPSFISHGTLPSQLGAFDWERLTGAKDDYQRLQRGIRALEFAPKIPGRRLNDRENLRHFPCRLIVMKKTAPILKRINGDLQRLSGRLEEIPALVIDDESDQASINTRPPSSKEEKERTATNREIVKLLSLLKRTQYVGYTATPFANVFIDPDDAADLFPKDYIVTLKRPNNYMGVSDFFDLAEDGGDLSDEEKPEGYNSNERAYVRNVYGEDEEARNLPKAVDSFILSGAVKLYRKAQNLNVSVKHHTMLVHRSTQISEHERDKQLVESLYHSSGPGERRFYDRLQCLWEEDFVPVTDAQAPNLVGPEKFSQLKRFINECIQRIEMEQPVRIVNSDKRWEEQLPDFDRDPVWSILVGGAKLSRGYTVEGLTVSYYRRRIRTADTLMQVGRWFGFRRGYQDLVRLFIGRREPETKKTTFDLYEAFKSLCRDEEEFRNELQRYVRDAKIKPVQVPPLVPSHLLRPTAKNKMYNAEIRYENMRGKWKEPVSPAIDSKGRLSNARGMKELALSGEEIGEVELGMTPVRGTMSSWNGIVFWIEPDQMLSFLRRYGWLERRRTLQREIEFLSQSRRRDPGVEKWLLIFPQKKDRGEVYWWPERRLSVFERGRMDGRFKAYSEPRHRAVAKYLAGVGDLPRPTEDTERVKRPETAVLVCYPVVESLEGKSGAVSDREITIGFGIQFPDNEVDEPISFGVRDPTREDAVVVDT